jgi:hypothetical protein
LVRGGRTVQELQEALDLEQPIVSQQLGLSRGLLKFSGGSLTLFLLNSAFNDHVLKTATA